MLRIIFLLLPIVLSGHAVSTHKDFRFIELPESINKDSDKILSDGEIKYDLAQALYALNTAYSGKKFLPKGEFETLVNNIEGLSGSMTAADLCARIDHFMSAVSDNHLSAELKGERCDKSRNMRRGQVGKNFYAKSEVPWKTEIAKRKNKTALLISITYFPSSTNPVWNGFLEGVQQKLPAADLVILDMRGNGGGDDSKGYELSTLLAGSKLKDPYAKQWTNSTPESMQLFVNLFGYFARARKAQGKEVPNYILELRDQFVEKRNKALNGEEIEEPSEEDRGGEFDWEKSIKKPIYILIDAECASSCESTTDFFEYNPLVKTVGENTAGCIHFGNNGIVVLKNSGIFLHMAISYNSYVDGRFIEKTGIKPKIPVPAGKDALDYAWDDFFRLLAPPRGGG